MCMFSELISRNGTIVMRASNAGLKCWLSVGRIFSHAAWPNKQEHADGRVGVTHAGVRHSKGLGHDR